MKQSILVMICLCLFLLVLSICFFVSAEENDTKVTIVEANIIEAEIIPDIQIQVPDRIILIGNASIGDISEDTKVYINNTGKLKISVTPELTDVNNELFSNLYFKKYKTGNSSQFFRIGEFTFNISAPPEGGFNDEYFYMVLNLSNYQGQSVLGKQEAEIYFIAVEA